jgi:hypothetical protein
VKFNDSLRALYSNLRARGESPQVVIDMFCGWFVGDELSHRGEVFRFASFLGTPLRKALSKMLRCRVRFVAKPLPKRLLLPGLFEDKE